MKKQRVARLMRTMVCVAGIAGFFATSVQAQEFGSFIGDLKTKWLPDGRTMELLEDFGFRDGNNLTWTAKKGAKIDGASIPQPFWSFIGGPFEGVYRNASVIHDYYCDNHLRTWQATHRVFYDGMRAAGVSSGKAKIMYYAVLVGGPRWERLSSNLNATICLNTGESSTCTNKAPQATAMAFSIKPILTETEINNVEAVKARLERGEDISLTELEQMAKSTARQNLPAMFQ